MGMSVLKANQKTHKTAGKNLLPEREKITVLSLWFSSVSIVSDYGLDGWGSTPDRGRGFFL
jgi:hypothetical protein